MLISIPANSFTYVNGYSFPPSFQGKNMPLKKKKKKELRILLEYFCEGGRYADGGVKGGRTEVLRRGEEG